MSTTLETARSERPDPSLDMEYAVGCEVWAREYARLARGRPFRSPRGLSGRATVRTVVRSLKMTAVDSAAAQVGSSGRRWWTLAGLSLASFLLTLRDTALAVALPSIGRELRLGLSGLEWVVNAHTLALSRSTTTERVEMSHFIDRLKDTLRGGGPRHVHDHVGGHEHGATQEHSGDLQNGAEQEHVSDESGAGEHEHRGHEGHKHC
jgi:hypothetical protein